MQQKLKQIIPEWLRYYREFYGDLNVDICNQLMAISAATIDRMLSSSVFKEQRKGLSGTKPGALLKNNILVHDNHWDLNKPGYFEADTVALCGDSLAGGSYFQGCTTLRLAEYHKRLNPFTLKQIIDNKLEAIMRLVKLPRL